MRALIGLVFVLLMSVTTSGREASANTVSIYDDANRYLLDATVTSSVTGSAISGFARSSFTTPLSATNFVLSGSRADQVQLASATAANELSFLNSLINPDMTSATVLCNGNCPDRVSISAKYFAITIGQDTAFFKVLASSIFNVTINLQDCFASIGHITVFNASPSAVPLPAALPLMLSALAGLGAVGFKRRSRSA